MGCRVGKSANAICGFSEDAQESLATEMLVFLRTNGIAGTRLENYYTFVLLFISWHAWRAFIPTAKMDCVMLHPLLPRCPR